MKSLKSLAGIAWSVLAASAVQVSADEVTKTWELELPEAAGITNNAPVVLTDGNYRLKAWVRTASAKTLGIGVPGDNLNGTTGLALMKDAAGKYIGSGDLDMRGAITVNGVVTDWRITRIGQYAFHSVSAAPWNECWLPTTLSDMAGSTFQGTGLTSGHNIFHIVAPNMAGELPNNTFLSSRCPRVLELKIPKVTCLAGYWSRTGYDDFLADTDVSDWDLSSVQSMANGSSQPKTASGWIFRWGSYRGTMHLPSLKYLNGMSFLNARNLNGLEIGRNGTLEYVGRDAAKNCASLGSIVLGGKSTGWTISTNAFYSANITNVTFLTVPPVYEDPNSIIFGTEETPARQIAFHIPARDSYGWQEHWSRFVAGARLPTDAERADFVSRFGAYAAEGLVGVVPPVAFRTAQEQWLVVGRSPVLRHTVKAAVLDPRFSGDAVSVTPPPDADGRYAPGTEVTFTATANTEKGRFVRWRGKGVPENLEENASLTLTVDRDLDVVAQFTHDWTFALDDPAAGFVAGKWGTIDNGIWKLRVGVHETGKMNLLYGTGSAGGAWTDKGEGLLDLNGRILLKNAEGGVQELNITGYNGNSFQGPSTASTDYKIPGSRYPRAQIMRESLAANPGQAHRCSGGSYAVTNFIYESPKTAVNFSADQFCGFAMNSGRLRLPKATRVPSAYTWSMTAVDVSDWRLDSVTSAYGEVAGQWGVCKGMFVGQAFVGTLHLPAMSTVQTNAFRAASKMEAVELGSNTVVTSIGTKAFNGCSGLARIQLRAGKELTVGANAFTGTAKLKTLEFTYEAPADPTAVDNMLVGETASVGANANPPIIYASRRMGWDGAHLANIKEPTEAELAARPFWVPSSPSLIGVWQTADGVRKAWVVNRPSADDPNGTLIIFR